MQFALIQGVRSVAERGLKAECLACGAPMVAKCGTRIIWHWAHAGRQHCDPWWENETEWHRRWKALFPEDQREIVHRDSATGEVHIADVKTAMGVVIEFQNSPMPPEELRARESFYGRMIWIVNGAPFRERFRILSKLPNPADEWVRDIVFSFSPRHSFVPPEVGWLFWRKSEQSGPLVLVHSHTEIEEQILLSYVGHHLLDWERPRTVWLEAQADVFIDLGGTRVLWKLGVYDERGLLCVQAVDKAALVAQNGGTYIEPDPDPIDESRQASPDVAASDVSEAEFDPPF